MRNVSSYSSIHDSGFEQKSSSPVSQITVRRTKWLFFGLCCYLISQGFTIPILAIGPSWAIWPTLSDLTTGLLLIIFLLSFRNTPVVSRASKNILCILIFIILGCILSFTWNLTWVGNENIKSSSFGIFQIYRLVEFASIFWVSAHTPLTPERIKLLRRIIETVLVFVFIGIVATYTAVVPLSMVTAHLPQEGAWIFYTASELSGGSEGLGFVGYNHGYVAAQVLMLTSLRSHLALNQKKLFSNSIFLLISIVACFLSGSRAGLAAMLIFAIICWIQKPVYALIAVTAAFITPFIASTTELQSTNLASSKVTIIKRQETLLRASNTENLSGRNQIWMDRIEFLDEEPIRWILGTGFGSAVDSGNNAHMLPLQIVLETGLIGLTIFIFLFYRILRYLYLLEPKGKPIFWVTTAFLVSSATQETFYPTPAFGHFIGFYLCSIAIALRNKFE